MSTPNFQPHNTSPDKPEPKEQVIDRTGISIDGGTQSRVKINEDVVDDYAEAMAAKIKLPPVVTFFDGVTHWLADGFHRYLAAEKLNAKKMRALVFHGTKRDALLYSAGSNTEHGLRRSAEDKRKAVTILLNDAEWSNWSNGEIARRCQVSTYLVAQVRQELTGKTSNDEVTYTTKHGTSATMMLPASGQNSEADNDPWDDDVDDDDASGVAVSSGPTPPQPSSTNAALVPVGAMTGDGALLLTNTNPDVNDDEVFDLPEGETEHSIPQVADEEDLTDEEWLATLPLNNKLAEFKNDPDAQVIFLEDALFWRTLKQNNLLLPLRKAAKLAQKKALKSTSVEGSFIARAVEFGTVAHPSTWTLCPQCQGSRTVWVNRVTGDIEAPGTTTANEENQLALRAGKQGCTCRGGYAL